MPILDLLTWQDRLRFVEEEYLDRYRRYGNDGVCIWAGGIRNGELYTLYEALDKFDQIIDDEERGMFITTEDGTLVWQWGDPMSWRRSLLLSELADLYPEFPLGDNLDGVNGGPATPPHPQQEDASEPPSILEALSMFIDSPEQPEQNYRIIPGILERDETAPTTASSNPVVQEWGREFEVRGDGW